LNSYPIDYHPNYNWRLGGEILLNSRDCNLFELYNGFPGTNNQGDDEHPGLEEVWDFMLTAGKLLHRTKSNPAAYDLSTDSGYVRARITDRAGHYAWIQPIFVVP
jgi:hypothetical protein